MTTYPMKLTCTKCGAVDEGTLHIEDSKPLTNKEIKELYGDDDNFRMTKKYVIAFARAIEAAHGIKENT